MERDISYTIIRIEHEDGFGMFRFPDASPRYTLGDTEETMDMFSRHRERNTPMQDGIVRSYDDTKDYFCAFSNMVDFEFLCKKDEIKFLATKCFKVLTLEVKKLIKGNHQVIFKKEDIISSKDITSLWL